MAIATLPKDFTLLPAGERAEYIRLIRANDISGALALSPRARTDAERVREALAVLSRRPAIEKGAQRVAALDLQLRTIDQDLAEPQQRRDKLAAERSAAQNEAGSLDGWRHHAGMVTQYEIVRRALADEIAAAHL